MNIRIEIIPQEQQLHPTLGNWRFVTVLKCPNCYLQINIGELPSPLKCPLCAQSLNGATAEEQLQIMVSKLSGWRLETIVAIQQLIDVLITKRN